MVPRGDIATATATFGFIRNLSTSISVVIGSVVFQNEMQKKRPILEAALGPTVAALLSGGSAGANVEIVKNLPEAQKVVARQAFYESLRTMWIIYVAFAGLGLVISMAVGKKELSNEHAVVKTGLEEEERKRQAKIREKRASKGLHGGKDVELGGAEGESAAAENRMSVVEGEKTTTKAE